MCKRNVNKLNCRKKSTKKCDYIFKKLLNVIGIGLLKKLNHSELLNILKVF